MRASFDKRISKIESKLQPEDDGKSGQVEWLYTRSPEQRLRIRKGIYAVLMAMYQPHAQLVIKDLKQAASNFSLWQVGTMFRKGSHTYCVCTPGKLKLTGEILGIVDYWRGEQPLKMPQVISQFLLDNDADSGLHLSDPCKECGLRHPGRGLSSTNEPIFPQCVQCKGQVITFSVMLEKKVGHYWPYERLQGTAPGYRLEDLDAVIVPDRLEYDFDPSTFKA